MLISLTGTPGTGKTSISEFLKEKSLDIIDLNKLVIEKKFVIGIDKKRHSKIIDIKKVNLYFNDFKPKNTVIIDGHLSHLIKNVDKVIILRCNPKKLKENLEKKRWNDKKIKENLEAEILDIILSESVQIHNENNIYEIDTSDLSIDKLANIILDLISSKFKNIKKYKIGKIDWSEDYISYLENL